MEIADVRATTEPITGSRAADAAVSRAYGSRGAAVHSPSSERPGAISDQLTRDFAAAGFPLATGATPAGTPRRDGDKSGRLIFSEPKNASRRTVGLPQRAVETLRSHRKEQAEEKLRATGYGDSGLAFATGKGTPHDSQNIINRYFKPLLKRAELPRIRWHDLRHTYATLLLARGTHPTYVQKSLGHASVQLTLDRYSHWMPTMGRNTADGIDEALG